MADDFTSWLMSQIGSNPTAFPQARGGGQIARGGNPLVAPQAPQAPGGGLQTPEARDPSTPSPSGRPLAYLKGAQQPQAPQAPGGGPLGGLGSDLSASMASYNPTLGRGGNALAGFAAGLKSSQDRDAARATNAYQAQKDQQKTAADTLKGMFDMSSKMFGQQTTQQTAATSASNKSAEDAETKRWHDIQHQDTQAKNAKDTTTDWTTPENMLNASRMEQGKLNELGIGGVALRDAQKAINNPATPDDQRAHLQAGIDAAKTQFQQWRAQQPWVSGGKKAAAPASDDTQQTTPTAPAIPAPTAAGAAPPPAAPDPAAPAPGNINDKPIDATWRKVKDNKTGDMHLWNPATNEIMPLQQAAPPPTPQGQDNQSGLSFPLD